MMSISAVKSVRYTIRTNTTPGRRPNCHWRLVKPNLRNWLANRTGRDAPPSEGGAFEEIGQCLKRQDELWAMSTE